MDAGEIAIEVLRSVVPIVIAAGAGGAAYWKNLQANEQARKKLLAEESRTKRDYRLKADDAAWERVHDVITEQQEEIKTLNNNINIWHKKFEESNDRLALIKDQMREYERRAYDDEMRLLDLERRMDICSAALEDREQRITELETIETNLLRENHSLREQLKATGD